MRGRMRASLSLIAVVSAALWSVGCGPNCQDACRRAYGEAPGECAVRIPGRTAGENFQECMTRCETALETPGELGSYDPYTRNTSGQTVQLTNERQAAEWMTCVVTSGCENLEEGFCEPI